MNIPILNPFTADRLPFRQFIYVYFLKNYKSIMC